MQNEAGSEPFAQEKTWRAGIEPPGASLCCGLSTRSVLARQSLHLIQIKIASWGVGEAARVEDLQRWIREALENASVNATKKVQFCPITAIYSK